MDNISINIQSSIRIHGSKVIYFDPYQISENVNDADIIFITHDHPDHFQPESIEKIIKDNSIIVMPFSMEKHKTKLNTDKIVYYKAYDEAQIEGIKIKTVPAYNKLKPFHPKGAGFLGYVVTMDNVTYYVAGDTDNNSELQNIACNVALVPIGGTFTMNASKAAELVNAIKPEYAIPTHYGNIVGDKKDEETFKNKVNEDINVVIKL